MPRGPRGESREGRVSSRAEQFRQRAAHRDHMASQVKDLDAKRSFVEVAAQWRELARVTEALDREQNEPPQPN
jgi:hypothetical protein